MNTAQSLPNIRYLIRHFLTFNVTDPLSNESRGYSQYTQYFSGTNASGQINYLERKPYSLSNFIVKVNGTQKTITTDYTLNTTTGRITWTGYTPPSGNDNIQVDYTAVKQWIYDDQPSLSTNTYPRITVEDVTSQYASSALSTYQSYNSGIGDTITTTFKIGIRNRQSNQEYTYGSIKYKNAALVQAVAENIKQAFNTNRHPLPFGLYNWEVKSVDRINTELDSGIWRWDVTVDVTNYDKVSIS